MSKIFIAKTVLLIIFNQVVFCQEVLIKPLSSTINSVGAEINFIKKNDTLAYFTKIIEDNNSIKSNIYTTTFNDGQWSAPLIGKYNYQGSSSANIFISDSNEVLLNLMDLQSDSYKLAYITKHNTSSFYEVFQNEPKNKLKIQATIGIHSNIKALYFVSDRKGGFGGLDIWVSIIDEKGNFGIPINAGNKINSSFDEITPFYNKYDQKIYFSSNKEEGEGGFDIYKSEGKLNLWKNVENVKELNTKQDEMYLNFYNSSSGYFASNRTGAQYLSSEFCCNDIFSFNYFYEDTLSLDLNIYLPINLYFHNDEPDCCTLSTKTEKTYKDSYIDYFRMQSDYESYNKNIEFFFRDSLQNNYNKLNLFLEKLLQEMQQIEFLEIQIRGYSSPLFSDKYNLNLSKRRISSFINYLLQYNDGAFNKYYNSKKLLISQLPFGESMSSKEINDNITEKEHSIYGINAMLERKIEIINVLYKK